MKKKARPKIPSPGSVFLVKIIGCGIVAGALIPLAIYAFPDNVEVTFGIVASYFLWAWAGNLISTMLNNLYKWAVHQRKSAEGELLDAMQRLETLKKVHENMKEGKETKGTPILQ